MPHSRRKFVQHSSLGLAALLLTPYSKMSAMTRNPAAMPGGLESLRRNVGFFTGKGGTIGWLVNKSGIVVIDSQFPDTAKTLIAEVQKKSDKKVDYLVNTHHHGDHTAGNIAFKDIVTNVIAHENSKANQMRVAKERDAEAGQLYPTMTFANEWSTEIGDEIISCTYHGKGHTNGDIISHFENANVVHTGDLMFNRRFPYIDKSAGANIGNWVSILDTMTSKFDDETIFIFGHSDNGYDITGNKADINAFKNYLEKLLKFAETSYKSGVSLEDLKSKTTAIPGAPQWQGNGISRSLDSAYAELKESK